MAASNGRFATAGTIPAHPLALTAGRKLDERRQRALSRYYLAAGAGGLAVGVHTTQFAIRDHGLLRPVLQIAAEAAAGTNALLIAGAIGKTKQAVAEAELAARLDYHAVLLSLAALKHETIDELIAHTQAVAAVMPVFGFYLQPAVGGRVLPYEFWRRFAEIEQVKAIKIAAFNRYQTIDVIRAVEDAGRQHNLPLYTGNDDNIVLDLLNPDFAGGLLGHWAVWTQQAARYQREATTLAQGGGAIAPHWLKLNRDVTDANAALFDAANHFQGCIAGLHEILRRQGLLAGRWCLDPDEDLSPGQLAEIDRVCRAYPHLKDDHFVQQHLDAWLR